MTDADLALPQKKALWMDVEHWRHMRWQKKDDTAAWRNYNRLRGQYASVLEGGIPERMFIDRSQCRYTDPSTTPPTVVNPTLADCPKAVSAASVLATAEAQGQRVYTISATNLATALPKINAAADVRSDIEDAVNAGKEVMIHQNAIDIDGWHGSGYAVIDPETGVGSYLIAGGARGASIARGILTALGIFLFFAGTAGVAPILLTIVTILSVFLALYAVLLNAIEILDVGGKCSVQLADLYLKLAGPLTALGILLSLLGGGKTATAIIFKLLAAIYGADLMKGIANAGACK